MYMQINGSFVMVVVGHHRRKTRQYRRYASFTDLMSYVI